MDLIILLGINHHPEDIEAAIEAELGGRTAPR